MQAIDKLRNIVKWADYQNEGFNDRFKSVADIEKAFDYCHAKGLEFLDSQSLNQLEDDEFKTVKNELKTLLGYNVI